MMPPTYGRGGQEPEPEPQRVDTTAASLGSDGSTVGAGLGDLRSAPPDPPPGERRTPRPASRRGPTAFLLKFLSGENSGVEPDMSCYAEVLSNAGFRNKILLKQLTKKDLVRCKIKKDHIKILLREVKRLRVESKAAAAATAAKIASLTPPSAPSASDTSGEHDAQTIAHFELVKVWLSKLCERSGEDLMGYTDQFYEYGIDMMSSVPLIEQSDLRDIGMPRHHAEIFFAAAEEEKRRQIDEGDRWDPTVSFQRELNKLNYRAGRGSRTNDTVELLSDPELRAKLFPGDEDCDDRRRGLCPGYRVLGDLIAKHAADSPAVAIAAVKEAVAGGENVSQRDIDDVTPISRAVQAGCLPVVIYLISVGADVESKDAYSLRPVHYAAFLGHADILRVLASRMPRDARRKPEQAPPGLDRTDARGNTPLHMAARNGHLDCVKLLLEHGVEHDGHANLYNETVENRTGATPLMLACAPPQRNAEVVRLLLEEGCQHRIATAREKQQPLHYASTAEIAEALLSFERDMPLIKARVVAPHPDVRATDALGGCTPLHVAARNGRTEIVEAILSHKRLIAKARAPVDAPMREAFERHAAGETPIVCASHHGYMATAKVLLEHGAAAGLGESNVVRPDADGEAGSGGKKKRRELKEQLEGAGTPLHVCPDPKEPTGGAGAGEPEPEPQPGSPQRGGLQLPEEVAAAISRGQAPDAPPPQDLDAGEADEPDPALAFVEFLFRNKIAKPCRRKCGQCKRKARLCAALLRDEDLPLLPDDLRMQQEQLRAQKSAMVEKETRREAILQHWQEDVGDEDEDNFEATLAKMKEEMAQDTR